MNKNSKYLRKKPEDKETREGAEQQAPPFPPDKQKRYMRRPSGQMRYEMLVERERRHAQDAENAEAQEPVPAPESAEQELPVTDAPPADVNPAEAENAEVSENASKSIFKAGKDYKPRQDFSTDEPERFAKGALVRTIVSCGILTAAAVVLQFLTFRLPLMPVFIRLDLSAIPELLAGVAFGPLAGILVILVKNIIYVAAYHSTVVSTALSNIICDSLFVIVASLIYARGMFSQRAMEKMFEKAEFTKDKRAFQIVKSGFAGTLITSVVNFFVFNYFTYPLIFKMFKSQGIDKKVYIEHYQLAFETLRGYLPGSLGGFLPDIDSITKGILIYNIPISFVKMIFVTLVVALIYRFLSDFFHYRFRPVVTD